MVHLASLERCFRCATIGAFMPIANIYISVEITVYVSALDAFAEFASVCLEEFFYFCPVCWFFTLIHPSPQTMNFCFRKSR